MGLARRLEMHDMQWCSPEVLRASWLGYDGDIVGDGVFGLEHPEALSHPKGVNEGRG